MEEPAEHPLHLVAVLDHGAHVGMQHGSHTTFGGTVADPVQVAQQQVPTVVVQGGAAVVAVQSGRRGEYEDLGASGLVLLQDAVDLRERIVTGPVHQHGCETTDGAQLVRREHPGHLVGIGGEKAFRAELGGGEPDVAHLVEHPARWELVAPVGDLADPPGDRCPGDPWLARCRWRGAGGSGEGCGGHCWTSAIRTGRCCCRESVAASAIHVTASASSTVQGDGRCPATTSVNAESSARKASESRSMKNAQGFPDGQLVSGFEVA